MLRRVIQIIADGIVVFSAVGEIYSTSVWLNEDTIPGGTAHVTFHEAPHGVQMTNAVSWRNKQLTSIQVQFNETFRTTQDV